MAEGLGLELAEKDTGAEKVFEIEKNFEEVVPEEGSEKNDLEINLEEAEEAETREPHAEAPQFHDVPGKYYEGEVVFSESGKVIDYIGAFGSTVAAHEQSSAGAPLGKILGLYQKVIAEGTATRRMKDPENSFVDIVHTLTKVGSDRIEIRITREQNLNEKFEGAKKSAELSPADLAQKTAVETFWNMATPAEIFRTEHLPDHHVEKVVPIENRRTVAAARMQGISLEGLLVPPAETPEAPARQQQSVYTIYEEETVESSNPPENRAPVLETGTNPTPPHQALEALHELLRAA